MRMLPALIGLLLASAPVRSASTPPEVDRAVTDALARTHAPSASIAVIKGGKIIEERAYGVADLAHGLRATPSMRYSIGSISKQFTAAAVLMLAEEGRLSLDDKVGRWFPKLTRASDITLRQVLSMTSGYPDFWPQDYVMPGMMHPTTPDQILAGWAQGPLEFEPGTKWQYSNTNYVIAAAIVEKVAGIPLFRFLQERVFRPLGMKSVIDTDQGELGTGEPRGYLQYGPGPARPAPKEGHGWMFGAGELAMTAHDLALWDLSLINQTLLKPQSYKALETSVLLANGASTGYGLGIGVAVKNQVRALSHDGEVSGFTADNVVFPDERAAVVVLVNLDGTDASGQIAHRIAEPLLTEADAGEAPALAKVKAIFAGLQRGQLDRGQFTSNANSYLTAEALRDFASTLGPMGAPTAFKQAAHSRRGGMVMRRYTVEFGGKSPLRVSTYWMPDGKLEQYMVSAGE